MLTENYEQTPPSQQQLKAWADEYSETFPVVCDEERYIHSYATKGKGEVKLPYYVLLGPGMEILTVAPEFPEAEIISAVAN